MARRLRREEGIRIYHYRAGFGQASVQTAKELGIVALCDHSIAHPRGTVGMSTRGHDTGDAQWFVNLRDNPRLELVD